MTLPRSPPSVRTRIRLSAKSRPGQRPPLAPTLLDDTDKDAAEALRTSVVAQAQRSPAAVTKQTTGLTKDGLPVQSFRTLLADVATLARNTLTTPSHRSIR